MRTVYAGFCIVLAGFALVQYNDPDAIVWFLIYAVPALWAALAALRPGRLAPRPPVVAAYLACLAAAIAGSLYLWPSLPAGWVGVETEREGLGVIIATIVLVAVGIGGWLRPGRWQPAAAP